ncbi:MAG: YqiA/YcfP family alpha/beta fold hydrolase, partial [Comamonas sp.]
MATTHLLYLHGFRSSPQSTKARTMAQYVHDQHPQVTWLCPQLPPSPQEAMDMVMHAVRDWPSAHMAVIGSSLGGYYATWVAHHKQCKAVLLNPAVWPDHTLEQYIGQQSQWHDPGEAFYFRPEYIQQLRDLGLHEQAAPAPQLGIFAKGDEVLDWRQMVAR